MSHVQDQAPTTSERVDSSRVLGPWLSMAATVTLSALLLAVSGFLFGTVEGDIPWPATPSEETVYYSARYLSWGGVALAFVGAVAVAVISKARLMTLRLGWGWAGLTFVACGLLGGIAFFSAYGIGHEHFLFAFTR